VMSATFRTSSWIPVLLAALPWSHGIGFARAADPARPDRANVALGTTGDRQDELKVAKVRRISHPGYGAGQCTFGIGDPWNYDRSRLMYNEGANFTEKYRDAEQPACIGRAKGNAGVLRANRWRTSASRLSLSADRGGGGCASPGRMLGGEGHARELREDVEIRRIQCQDG
jgi:hypothetical protein